MSVNSEVIQAVKDEFREDIIYAVDRKDRRIVLTVKKDSLKKLCKFLKEKQGFDHLTSIAAVDRSGLITGMREKQLLYYNDFEVVYHTWSHSKKTLIEIKVAVPKDQASVPTVTDVWSTANWQERETYDLMGVKFEGHPDLRRLLMPEWWKGHPLRKDYEMAPGKWFLSESDEKEEYVLDYQKPVFPLDLNLPEKVKAEQVSEMILRIGPVHPGNHGPWLINVKLDGEVVIDIDPQIGYIHRGLEKIAENRTWTQYLPLSDRYCWLTALSNNMSYVLAVEDILDVEAPPRAQYLRTIMLELNRLASHLLWLAAMGIDLGNLTGFFYPFREREWILDLLEMASGNRMNYNYGRFGGVIFDVDDKFVEKAKKTMKIFRPRLAEYEDLFDGSSIWHVRTKNVGTLSASDAKDLGITGPLLRCAGVKADARKDDPYAAYPELDFEIPTRKDGDVYASYEVRMEEMRISADIIDQALDNLPTGPVQTDLGRIEPVGEGISRIEDPRGEIATYVIGDGGNKPYRLRVRTPEYINVSALGHMSRGYKIADLIAIIGGIDPCLGGIDR
ncbi:NADH-quinone oxidoreductase subunit C/D [archaeon BMS3Bbin16]|nr:NADH-quinone oxidoreductase subunit C/D [archaeon BMS3Bbin16]